MELNPEQKKAVESERGKILVLAGAGTGKTRTLTARIAYLISRGVGRDHILGVTFTNKAAQEIKERVEADCGAGDFRYLGTFHGVCNKILRLYGYLVGLDSNYQIMDTSESRQLIKKITDDNWEDLQIDPSIDISKKELINKSSKIISDHLESGLGWEKYENDSYVDWDMKGLFKIYQEIKSKRGLLDFSDLINLCIKLLKENSDIKKKFNDKFEHVLVDEFQDTNKIQMEWLELISNKNLFVVGDDDQSIYGFRGADISNILNFPKNNSGCQIIKLEENYRSSGNILEYANKLIDYNETRHEKKLWTGADSGRVVNIVGNKNSYEESLYVINDIQRLVVSGVELEDIAVLYRANYLSRNIEKALMTEGMPYNIIGGIGFWQRAEIKNILSYLYFSNNKNNIISFMRSVSFPARGVGKKTIDKIVMKAEDDKINYIEAILALIESKALKGKQKQQLVKYMDLIDSINTMGISESIEYIENDINIEGIYKDDDDKLGYCAELIKAGEEFEMEGGDLNDFLANSSLLGSVDSSSYKGVNLSTVHSSKGLEFEHVFIIAFEDGIFPSSRSIDQGEIEEERRLAYVAVTRAKKTLAITYCRNRGFGNYSDPMIKSRFIDEVKDY
jgi:DNA helicase-2/ATP-dependent DNA helicase PcrA